MDKICLYFPSFRGGGAERVMVTLAKHMALRGYDVDLVVVDASGPYLAEVPPNINIVDLNCRKVIFSVIPFARYLRKAKPICILSTMNNANVVAVLASLLSRSRAKLVLREANTLQYANTTGAPMSEKIIVSLMRVLYPFCSRIVAVSQDVKTDLVSYVGLKEESVSIIYNPVMSAEFLQQADESVLTDWLDGARGSILVAMGRMSRQKDFPTLITAFKQVCQQREATLVILGEGSDRGMLEDLISEIGLDGKVLMPGFVANPFPIIKRADLFVLSSLWEGLPNGLIQALCLGVKVVSTDCPGGSSEILDGGRFGGLVPVSNPGEMAKAINTALADNDVSASEVREHCENKFGVDAVVSQYLECLGVESA